MPTFYLVNPLARPNTVATANLQDDAVTLAKIAAGTQGGIVYFGAAGAPTELAAGTAGYVLTSGGAGADPSWTNAGVLTKIAETTLTGTSAAVEFASIATGYKTFMIKVAGNSASAGPSIYIMFNDDAGANQYKTEQAEISGAAIGCASSSMTQGVIADFTQSVAFQIFVDIGNFTAAAGQYKTWVSHGGGSTKGNICSGYWNNTANEISKITIQGPTFAIGSRFTLFGAA